MPSAKLKFYALSTPIWWPAVRRATADQPALAAAVLALTVVTGLLPVGFILASANLVVAVIRAPVGRTNAGDHVVVPLVAAVIALVFAMQILSVTREACTEALGRRMDMLFRDRLMALIAEPTGIDHLDAEESLERLAAAKGVVNRLSGPAGGLLGLVGRVYQLIFAAACLLVVGRGTPAGAAVLLVVGAGTAVWFRARFATIALEVDVGSGPLRRVHYLRDLVLLPGAEKEVTGFGLGGWLADEHDRAWAEVLTRAWARIGHRGTLLGLSLLFAAAESFAIWSAYQRQSAGLAGLVTFVEGVQACVALVGLVFISEWDRLASVGWTAVQALADLEVRQAHAAGENLPPAAMAPGVAAGQGAIVFDRVSFAYPNGRSVLRGVSFRIEGGGTTAIVGVNGAGKSTILSLIGRLYEPQAGRVLLDATPLPEFDATAWRARLAAVFQRATRLPGSLRDNVTWGCPDAPPSQAVLDEIAVQADLAGLLGTLPNGWDTLLNRQLAGGTDLSGGEWQKVALARGLYALWQGASVLLLDEPTAALDIEAERAVYEAIIDATVGATVVLVSHRFATVRKAQNILVLDDGMIVESGSHEDLMALGGKYAAMYTAQSALVS